MNNNPFLSICLPCYGRVDYVRKTLESIYEDNSDVPLDEYEVVISDNDPNKAIFTLVKDLPYPNLHYHYTNCEGFLNSYYVLTYGSGNLLLLHNSQVLFRTGALKIILEELKHYLKERPLIYYSNGMLYHYKSEIFDSFDEYCYHLSYWPSWSNGFSIWKDDFDKLLSPNLNKLFPHVSLFISQHRKGQFVSNDNYLFETQRVKGRSGHNKFEAFTIEYPSLINECKQKGWISLKTKDRILHDILTHYLPTLLFNKYVARIEFYDISGFKENIKLYFPRHAFWIAWLNVPLVPIRMLCRKINQRTKGRNSKNNTLEMKIYRMSTGGVLRKAA